jgi:hypothetical protein
MNRTHGQNDGTAVGYERDVLTHTFADYRESEVSDES